MKTYLALAVSLGLMTLQVSAPAMASGACIKASDGALISSINRIPLCHEMSTAKSISLFFSTLAAIKKECPAGASIETINNSYVVLASPEIKAEGFNECVGQILPADPGIPTCVVIWCTPSN